MTKTDLRRHIQPLVAKLGDQLLELVWANVTAARDRALEVATAQLAAELDAALTSVTRVADRDPKPEKTIRTKKPRAIAKPAPAKRTSPTCSKCSETGHNARTCPAARAELDDQEPDDAPAPTPQAPPPISSRSCRSFRCHRGGGSAPNNRRPRRSGSRRIGVRSSWRCRRSRSTGSWADT